MFYLVLNIIHNWHVLWNYDAGSIVSGEKTMKLFSEGKTYKLYQGTMLDMGEVIQPNSIDSIVTDPPYGLTSIVKRFGSENSAPNQYGKDGSFARLTKGFMGKAWDGSGIEYNINTWQECYKALKPGGYLLAFGGSRTFYRIACAIEDAGFEIRDTIMWLYGSGFPKSMNIGLAIDNKNGVDSPVISSSDFPDIRKGKYENNNGARIIVEQKQAQNEWSGWGTALKPSFEPIIVARKPFKGSCVDNVVKYGTGGLNIDGCRVGNEIIKGGTAPKMGAGDLGVCNFATVGAERIERQDTVGRFPANTILTYDDTDFDEVCGGFPNTKNGVAVRHNSGGNTFGGNNKKPPMEDLGYNDSGSAARYFYCAKASKKDRDDGLDAFEEKVDCDRNPEAYSASTAFNRSARPKKNTHPTVKPTELMQYLIRLVTPRGGTILDPFNGSGSTGKAAMYENKERDAGYKYIGIDLEEEYLQISQARIEYVAGKSTAETPDINPGIIEKQGEQLSIFDYLGE